MAPLTSRRNFRSAVKGLAIIASVILVALGPPGAEGVRRAARHSPPTVNLLEFNQTQNSVGEITTQSGANHSAPVAAAAAVPLAAPAAAIKEDPPRRIARPCKKAGCWRPHHLALSDHPAWISKHMGYEDVGRGVRLHPPNRHAGGTGETLPWVVNRTHSDPMYQEKHWWRLRPHDEAVGPEVLSCRSVEPFKFYLMEEALLPNCTSFSSGKELNDKIPMGGGQHIGEMFFYWQLRDHPWRTYDPMEAQIVVVPMFATLLVRGVCGHIADGINHVVDALEASPRYHLNQGKDFLMITTDFKPQYHLMQGNIHNKPRFVAATKNFIFVSRLNGKFTRLRSIQGNANPSRCILAAPYTSKSALNQCVGNDKDGLTCPGLDSHEKTFEEFMQKRNLTMFFMGQADDRIAHQSRRQIVTELAELLGPNYLVAASKSYKVGRLACGAGDPFQWNGCFHQGTDKDVYSSMLSGAKISLYSGGDDPTSSRFYDAFAFGTPQIVISEGFYDQGAPFRCAVDHASIYYNLNEITFQAAPRKYMHESLYRLMGNNYGTGSGTGGADLLRKKWEAQRAAAPDLLWHVPGSRVAHNVLEDAFRHCLTDYRGNNDGAR